MRALDGVDLTIEPGITGLLGPNGAGKSTLIKLILGLVRKTSGTGTVLGFDINTDGREIRTRVGYMPEDDCYIPGMSGVQVVQFSAALAGLPGTEALRRAHEILDFCGMKQERYREIDTYSTGMRQKVKFAAAIVHDPEFLILDEPTSGLDPEEREALLSRIKLLSRSYGKSVLISTHILPDVQAICDDVVILASGKIRLQKSILELSQRESPSFNVRVLGDAAEFEKQIRQRGLTPQPAENGGLDIESESERLSELIWESVEASNVSLHSLIPAKTSLEQIFMETVREAANANS